MERFCQNAFAPREAMAVVAAGTDDGAGEIISPVLVAQPLRTRRWFAHPVFQSSTSCFFM